MSAGDVTTSPLPPAASLQCELPVRPHRPLVPWDDGVDVRFDCLDYPVRQGVHRVLDEVSEGISLDEINSEVTFESLRFELTLKTDVVCLVRLRIRRCSVNHVELRRHHEDRDEE